MVRPVNGLWSAYKLSCGRAIIYCGLTINNPVVSEVKSEISLFTSFPFYENYVVMELVKNYAYARDGALLSFYRDDKAKEIDVFVEENGRIHPLEIKKSANPEKKDIRKFSVIEKTSLTRGSGGIICMFPRPFPIDADNSLIPGNLI